MTRVAQKNEELSYLDEFLRNQLKFNVTELKPALKEPPDGSATITNADGTTLLLDFEIAEFYVDDPGNRKGGSPSKRASGFWDKVAAEVVTRIEGLRIPVLMHVFLKALELLKGNHIRPLADQLSGFAQKFCPEGYRDRTHHEAFSTASFPLIHEHVEWISLTRLDGTYGIRPICWNLAAAFAGPRTANIKNHILLKSGKENFTWRPGAEKGLLIYASGGTVTSRAGPPPPDPSVWADKELISACEASIFDRVYFWDRVRRWYKRLK